MRNRDLLLIPGPTPVVDEIYDALALETRGHTDPRFVKMRYSKQKSCFKRMEKYLSLLAQER